MTVVSLNSRNAIAVRVIRDGKSGPDDKRCTIEARLAGRDPVAVTHDAGTIDEAVSGGVARLRRALESTLGRLAEY